MYDDYVWLIVVGSMVCFAMAWGIGANDVANSFGTSVGAKTVTLKQACMIAAVFEFAGAMTLGRVVTGTISGGIARTSTFANDPEIFAYGMLCALVAASTWLYVATYYSMAVSTTHSIIGGVVGFALVFKGDAAIVWNDEKVDFPFRSGISVIVLSWFTSPIFAAIAAAIIFLLCRTLVLRRERSFEKTFYVLPVAILVTCFINVFFVLSKGAGKMLLDEANKPGGDQSWCETSAAGKKCSVVNTSKAAWVSIAAAAGTAVIASVILIPILKKRAQKQLEEAEKQSIQVKGDEEVAAEAEPTTFFGKLKAAAMKGVEQDIHANTMQDESVFDMHERFEQFDPKAEIAFQYLQVFSACCVSFAHGANDVANAVGPLVGIVSAIEQNKFVEKEEAPVWCLIIGAVGLVIGLATYGYKIMAALGVKMAAMTPSRGYAAELSTSLVIAIASAYGMPISTTHTITGAVVGVGACEGAKGVNWKFLGKTFTGWVFTLIIVGLGSAALFAQGAFAPSIQASKTIGFYEKNITAATTYMTGKINSTLIASKTTLIALDSNVTYGAYLSYIAKLSNNAKYEVDTKKTGTANQELVVGYLYKAMSFMQEHSFFWLGQNDVSMLNELGMDKAPFNTGLTPTTECATNTSATGVASKCYKLSPQLVDSKIRTTKFTKTTATWP